MEKDKNKDRERELSDISVVLNTPEGRRFYWRIMEVCGVWTDPYCGTDRDTSYMCGRKSIGLGLYADLLEAKPSAFQQMQREHNSKQTIDNMKHEDELKQIDVLTRSV